jgi:hypothetical protein
VLPSTRTGVRADVLADVLAAVQAVDEAVDQGVEGEGASWRAIRLSGTTPR